MDDDEVLYEVMKSQKRIVELTLTKTYNFSFSRVLKVITSQHLQIINLSDSKFLNDDDITLLSQGCSNLREVNLSWCNGLTSYGLTNLIHNCLQIEVLSIAGVKESRDVIFGEGYTSLMKYFDETAFSKAKNIISQCDTLAEREQFYDIRRYFKGKVDTSSIKIMKRLKTLDCQSCNGVSDNILKIIFLVCPRVRAYNYYGNYMGLIPSENESTFC
jgi:hypothetical protein